MKIKLFCFLIILPYIICNTNIEKYKWVDSKNVSKWYTPFDLCLLSNSSSLPVETILADCEEKVKISIPDLSLRPIRCRAGNSWPSKSGFCSSSDIPFSERKNLQRTLEGYDDPTDEPLRRLFTILSKEKGSLILIGDSVMQQFFGAMACELERNGIWSDPNYFRNTDEVRFVEILDKNTGGAVYDNKGVSLPPVAVKFTPIYHLVNGRWDRMVNASMHRLRLSVDDFLNKFESVMIMVNMGLHFVGNPVPHFSPADYNSQMTYLLQYLHNIQNGRPEKKLRTIWRETSAQHFSTTTGYWPGQRFADSMKLGCFPITDPSPQGDWRNTDIENIIAKNNLYRVKIAPFFNLSVPLWNMHVNGFKHDCTHFCWTPYLYQSLFHFMADYDLIK
jgi:hypothetical protein